MTDTLQKQKEDAMALQSMLLSPPEARHPADFFESPESSSKSRTTSQSTTMAPASARIASQPMLAPKKTERLPISPPISPHTQLNEIHQAEEGTRDPPLFARGDSDVSQGPLFSQDEQQTAIDSHVAANGRICATEDYRLVLEACSRTVFTSNLGELLRKDPQRYLQSCKDDLKFYDNIAAEKRAKARAAAAGTHSSNTKPARRTVSHRPLAPAPEGGVRKKVTTPRTRKQPKPKVSPPQHIFAADFAFPAFPAREVVAKVQKQPSSRDDIGFYDIADFCPPVSTLGNNSKALKADWKGQVLNLSADPDRHLLHEAEVNLAATLRLSCAVYLASKRRIFIKRVQCGEIGKEFRKTDAQQACKIDVNKASKLWMAFEKVGWFDDHWFVGKRA